MSGFALTHRTVFDHPLFEGDASRLGAWLWLVGKACWRPTQFNVNGKMVTLQRGQVCASVRQLGEQWGWSKSAVDRFLARLKTETMIETEAGHGRLVITICNYSKYQDQEDDGRDSSGTAAGTAAGQQRDIKEQGNKGTREEEPNGSSSRPANEPAGDGLKEQMDQVVEAWNRVALPLMLGRCQTLSPKRMASLKARLKDHGLEPILMAIAHVPKTKFLRGESGDWGGASFDFLLRPDSVLNILEGKYDDRQHSRPEPSTTRQIGERVAARFAAGSGGSADIVPRLGAPGRYDRE